MTSHLAVQVVQMVWHVAGLLEFAVQALGESTVKKHKFKLDGNKKRIK